MKFWENSSL